MFSVKLGDPSLWAHIPVRQLVPASSPPPRLPPLTMLTVHKAKQGSQGQAAR